MAERETGKRALITGASKGLGLAVAERLQSLGYSVVGWSRSEPAEFPGEWLACDVSDSEAIAAALEATLAGGPIDCLLNSAALPSKDRFGEIGLDALTSSFDVHARAALQLMQGVAPGMRERGWGRIVNVLSTIMTGCTERTAYRAGKEAARSLTVSAALELAETGITVNGVAPGPLDTATFRNANPDGSRGSTYWLELVPMARFGREEEVSAAIEFFFSEQSSFITGQVLFVDGGMSVGRVIDV